MKPKNNNYKNIIKRIGISFCLFIVANFLIYFAKWYFFNDFPLKRAMLAFCVLIFSFIMRRLWDYAKELFVYIKQKYMTRK